MDTVSAFHPAVWAIVTAIVLPLLGVIMGFLIYWIRLMDQRVVGLCRSVARIEGRLGISPYSGLADNPPSEFEASPSSERESDR